MNFQRHCYYSRDEDGPNLAFGLQNFRSNDDGFENSSDTSQDSYFTHGCAYDRAIEVANEIRDKAIAASEKIVDKSVRDIAFSEALKIHEDAVNQALQDLRESGHEDYLNHGRGDSETDDDEVKSPDDGS
jgi:hypothetical protein